MLEWRYLTNEITLSNGGSRTYRLKNVENDDNHDKNIGLDFTHSYEHMNCDSSTYNDNKRVNIHGYNVGSTAQRDQQLP